MAVRCPQGGGEAWVGREQGWVQMEATEGIQDAGGGDLGPVPALCPAQAGQRGLGGAEPLPASRISEGGRLSVKGTVCGRGCTEVGDT